VICCTLGIACTSKADDESGIVSDIRAGYAAFTNGKNARKLVHKDGVYYKEGAVIVPDVRAVMVRILRDLHDSAYAGHVGGFQSVKNVQRLYWWPRNPSVRLADS